MSKKFSHKISADDKHRHQLSLDLLIVGVLSEDFHRISGGTAAEVNLNQKQVAALQAKGYQVETPKP